MGGLLYNPHKTECDKPAGPGVSYRNLIFQPFSAIFIVAKRRLLFLKTIVHVKRGESYFFFNLPSCLPSFFFLSSFPLSSPFSPSLRELKWRVFSFLFLFFKYMFIVGKNKTRKYPSISTTEINTVKCLNIQMYRSVKIFLNMRSLYTCSCTVLKGIFVMPENSERQVARWPRWCYKSTREGLTVYN